MAHEGMSMLSTEDGGDCSAAHLLCDAEGCCARQIAKPSASSLHAPLPLRKEAHCFCMTVASCVHESCLTVTLCIPPSFSASSPTASACPQMTSSPPVASPAPLYSGGRAPEGLAQLWPPGVRGSRLSTGRSPRFGRGVSGNSPGSPSALPWLSECRAALLLQARSYPRR